MQQHLTDQVKTIRTLGPVAAGQTQQTSGIIDTAGYEGVRFVAAFGTLAASATVEVKAQQGDASDMSDGDDLEGSAIDLTETDDDIMVILDLARVEKRYVQLVISRAGGNSTIDYVIAELYGPRDMPVTKDATVASQLTLTSPDEGTA